jgi:hypothetical protein
LQIVPLKTFKFADPAKVEHHHHMHQS